MIQKSYDESATLYVVPTPIGNLEDMTFRAIKILREVSFICCEDTRTSGKLLKYFDIKNKLMSLNEQNEKEKLKEVINELSIGNDVGIISDAGTPIICDPGYKVVKEVIDSGYNVVCLPGATAFVPALVTSGLKPYPFLFIGFLNSKAGKRKKELQKYSNYEYTMVFYEAPHRVKKTLNDMKSVWGNKNIIISREISKLYEEIFRGTIDEYLNEEVNIKGEFVIIVEGSVKKDEEVDVIALVSEYIKSGLTKKKAIERVSSEMDISRRKVYNEFHRGD